MTLQLLRSLYHNYYNNIINTEGDQLCSEMEVLESQNVIKSFVPKLDVKGDQDYSQTDGKLSSKVDRRSMHARKLRVYPKSLRIILTKENCLALQAN